MTDTRRRIARLLSVTTAVLALALGSAPPASPTQEEPPDAGTQVHTSGAFGGVCRERDLTADAIIENLKLYFSHAACFYCIDGQPG